MRPSSGRSKPAISRSVVVLPEPEGPSRVKNSPAGISRSTRSTATTSPYVLRIPSSRTSISAAGTRCGAESVSASAGVAKRFLQQIKPALEERVVDREGHEDANHVPVDTARQQDEAAVTCGRGHRLRKLRGGVGQLEGEHRPEPANLADRGVARRELLEASTNADAQVVGALAEPFACDLAQDLGRRGTGEGVPSEGPAEASGRNRVHQLGRAGHSGER